MPTQAATLEETITARVAEMLMPILINAVKSGVGTDRLDSLEKSIASLEKRIASFAVQPMLLTPEEVSKITTYSISTLYRRVEAGKFPPPFEKGAITRWRVADIKEYFNSPTRQPYHEGGSGNDDRDRKGKARIRGKRNSGI